MSFRKRPGSSEGAQFFLCTKRGKSKMDLMSCVLKGIIKGENRWLQEENTDAIQTATGNGQLLNHFPGIVAKHKERGGEPYKEISQNAEEKKQLFQKASVGLSRILVIDADQFEKLGCSSALAKLPKQVHMQTTHSTEGSGFSLLGLD